MATALSTAPLRDVSLDDKYELETGRVFVTGVQALVRLLILQHQRDKLAGLNTAGFVSGYRGSPLGGLDQLAGAGDRGRLGGVGSAEQSGLRRCRGRRRGGPGCTAV